MIFKNCAAALCMSAVFTAPVFGLTTRSLQIASPQEFSTGEFVNTWVDDDGLLQLTPGCREIIDTGERVIWSVCADESGLFAGTGHDGTLLAYDAGFSKTALIRLDAQEITALEIHGEKVYCGTGPKGVIFVTDRSVTGARVLAILPGQYVWDLLFDGKYLLAATGSPGAIYRVDTDTGDFKELLSTQEENILHLAVRGDDIWASSSGAGYLYRINKRGDFDILYDAGGKDINSFAFCDTGVVLGTAGQKMIEVQPQNGNTKDGKPDAFFENQLVYIDWTTAITVLATVRNQTISAVIGAGGSSFFFGTGEGGEVHQGDVMRRRTRLLYRIPDAAISSFYRSGEEIFIGTGTAARIHLLMPEFPQEGYYISDILDTRGSATWGAIHYKHYGSDGTVKWQYRTGNTFLPDFGWGEWESLPGSRSIDADPSRFIQLKAILRPDNNSSPAVSDIRVFYAVPNEPASLTDISIGRNLRLEKMHKLRISEEEVMVSWQVDNPDNDELRFSVWYQRDGLSNWTALVDDLDNPFYIINPYGFPDGEYRFRVTLHDRSSNPDSVAWSDSRTTRLTLIDNTPPYLKDVKLRRTKQGLELSGKVIDDAGIIRLVRYSSQPEEFHLVAADDGVYDSAEEEFEAVIEQYGDTLIIYAEDEHGNGSYRNFSVDQ